MVSSQAGLKALAKYEEKKLQNLQNLSKSERISNNCTLEMNHENLVQNHSSDVINRNRAKKEQHCKKTKYFF